MKNHYTNHQFALGLACDLAQLAPDSYDEATSLTREIDRMVGVEHMIPDHQRAVILWPHDVAVMARRPHLSVMTGRWLASISA